MKICSLNAFVSFFIFIFCLFSIMKITVSDSIEAALVASTTPPTTLNYLQRVLSLSKDWFTGQSVVTYNGQVPFVSCPLGTYRPSGSTNLRMVSGQRDDGCWSCPRGKYGSTTGLTNSGCTGQCPKGTWSSNVGLTDISQCELCPLGTYGSTSGLRTRACTAGCPTGKYNKNPGSYSISDCILCPTGYESAQCHWVITIFQLF